MNYEEFLKTKIEFDAPSGFDGSDEIIPDQLFDFQKAIVKWALRRGRAAIFADTGLGKTFMQVAWANCVHQYTGNRVLIVAPLCVSQQTVEEAKKLNIPVTYTREMPIETGIYITNYEMLDHFDFSTGYFDGVVLDESSIIKHETSKTRKKIIDQCSEIPYRLSCTATPSPNDYMELGNQAEFLGVMPMAQMLPMFFTHDSGQTSKWRLKGHAKGEFWKWLSQWACVVKKPSDLGFSDEGYDLPALNMIEDVVETGRSIAKTLSERNAARRESVEARVKRCAEIVNASDRQWLVWCHLNDESKLLTEMIEGAVEVTGSDKIEKKEKAIWDFTEGRARVLVTKPKIAGFGMNWQHCADMAFVGLSDSYEQLYQAVRRCYRFGQEKPVNVHLISADSEGAVLENIKRKEAQSEEMGRYMLEHMRDLCTREVTSLKREVGKYERDRFKVGDFDLHLGDCVEVAKEIESDSIGYSIFSPPFASLYTYSNQERDMGNSRSYQEFWNHFDYLIDEIFRITEPGRLVSIHCMNLPTSKQFHGYIGMQDFRGEIIRHFQNAGFIYHSEACIWKNPVVAMQRTKALGLLWKQIKKDSSMSRQGIPDYLVTLRKPGENQKPLSHTPEEFPVNLWQELASPCYMDINQSNTLNRKLAREEDDERHICPLQLDLIERALFLWSQKGDRVFSPFTGIGSEGYVALSMGRKFIGSELKRSYFEVAADNLQNAPRADYKFPFFQEKIGRWPNEEEQTESFDPNRPGIHIPEQVDWISRLNDKSVIQ